MKILAFDPSGNYEEGFGTTGWALAMDGFPPTQLGQIKAADYKSRQSYWAEHRNLIETLHPDVVVIESYRLFGHKSKEQIGSSLETPMLIGYMEMICYDYMIPVVIQDPSTKQRHADDVLLKIGVIEKKGTRYYYRGELTSLHQRDALRHAMYYQRKLKMEGKLK